MSKSGNIVLQLKAYLLESVEQRITASENFVSRKHTYCQKWNIRLFEHQSIPRRESTNSRP